MFSIKENIFKAYYSGVDLGFSVGGQKDIESDLNC